MTRRGRRPDGPRPRRTGAPSTSCGPREFVRDFTVFAPGSVLVSMGRTRVLCTASVEDRVPPWMRGSGKGWVTAEYSLLPGSTGGAGRTRGRQGQAVRADPGDPAPDRPLAALGVRPGRPRRAPGHGRLRRPPGRRRDADGLDLRRLRRAPRRAHPAGRRRDAPRPAPERRGGGGLGRDRRRGRACSTCPTRRTSGRGRHERGDDRSTGGSSRSRAPPRACPLRRGSSTRCSASPSTGSRSCSSSRRSPGRDAPRTRGDAGARCSCSRPANPDKAAEIAAILASVARAGPASPPDVGVRGRRDRGHARGQRPAEGPQPGRGDRRWPPSPTTPGSRSTRWAVPRASTRRASRAHATYADNVAKLLGELDRSARTTPRAAPGAVPLRGAGRVRRR